MKQTDSRNKMTGTPKFGIVRKLSRAAAMLLFLNVCGGELLRDPSFEENSGVWPLPPGYRIERHAGRNGSTGLVYTRTDPGEYPLPQVAVDLKAGTTYDFKVWIRVEDVKGEGASACVEYSTRSGKYLGGLYLDNVSDNSGKWHELSGAFTVPEDVVCKVTAYLRPGSTGTAYFDDFSLRAREERCLIYATRDHNYLEKDGTLELKIFCNNRAVPAERKMICRLQAGSVQLEQRVEGDTIRFAIPDAVPDKTPCRIALIDSETGDVKLETELPIVRPPASAPAELCRLSSDGIAIADGRRFMPLGFYCHQITEKNIELAHSAGANTLLSYNLIYAQPGNVGGLEGIGKILDLLQENGMKILFSIKDIYPATVAEWNGIQGSDRIVETMVKAFRDHPALLGWYICDEMPASQQDTLIARRRLVNELDPHHPAYAVFYQFSELTGYAPGLDVLGVDPYPILGLDPAATDMTMVEFAMEQARRTGKPIWAVPQAFDFTVYGKAGRFPTEQEMRSMSLLMAGLGAKGFIYYLLEDLWSDKLPPDNFEKNWPKLRAVVSGMKELEVFIVSGEPIRELETACAAGKVRAFELTAADGEKAVLVCAITAGNSEAEFPLSGEWESLYGKTLFDNGKARFSGNGIDSDVLRRK